MSADRKPIIDGRPVVCIIDGCNRPVRSQNLCQGHLTRIARHGSPYADLKKLPNGARRQWVETAVAAHKGDGCLLFPFPIDKKGYGAINIGRKKFAAHRFAWELCNGQIPCGMNVLHKCDVPACVNPNHLFLGTQAENLADMRAKGRSAMGEKNGQAKLTPAEVRQIRSEVGSQRSIGGKYGVAQTVIGDILRRKSWRFVP